MNKQEVRKGKLEERDAIAAPLIREWSEAMCLTLQQCFEYQHAASLHVYLSKGSEPDTMPLIRQAWEDGKEVFVPITIPGDRELKHARFSSGDSVRAGEFGVPVPISPMLYTKEEVLASKPLVVVPLLAFNQQLFRVGYGGGYYDRFLRDAALFAFGYCYSMCYSDEFLTESHDVQLDAIVCEQGLIRTLKTTQPLPQTPIVFR